MLYTLIHTPYLLVVLTPSTTPPHLSFIFHNSSLCHLEVIINSLYNVSFRGSLFKLETNKSMNNFSNNKTSLKIFVVPSDIFLLLLVLWHAKPYLSMPKSPLMTPGPQVWHRGTKSWYLGKYPTLNEATLKGLYTMTN